MTFDWFTFIAQLINFALLLVLLRVFLYRPILDVMEQREKQLTDLWQAAEAARGDAATALKKLEAEKHDLSEKRLERLNRIEEEADALLAQRVSEVELELQSIRARHDSALQESWRQSVDNLRHRTAQLLVRELRNSLRDLADTDLEQHTLHSFLRRLRQLPDSELESLKAGAADATPEVVTAFELTDEVKAELEKTLREQLDVTGSPTFRQDPELLFGVELTLGAQHLALSGAQRLHALDLAFRDALSDLEQDRSAAEADHVSD